jgi:hypothetical protein
VSFTKALMFLTIALASPYIVPTEAGESDFAVKDIAINEPLSGPTSKTATLTVGGEWSPAQVRMDRTERE